MTVLKTGPGPLMAAFLIREANGMYRSREEADVSVPANTRLEPGTLLQQDGTTKVYSRLTGAGTVAGILFEGIGADTAVQVARRTVVVRDAEVHKTELIYAADATPAQITAADTGLRALGIIPRL